MREEYVSLAIAIMQALGLAGGFVMVRLFATNVRRFIVVLLGLIVFILALYLLVAGSQATILLRWVVDLPLQLVFMIAVYVLSKSSNRTRGWILSIILFAAFVPLTSNGWTAVSLVEYWLIIIASCASGVACL